MREKHTVQRSIFEHYAEHEIGLELKSISGWLDQHIDLLDWVAADINPCSVEDTGRKGLSVESVLRCAILKQFRQMTYEDLVFCLMDSVSCQTFARLNHGSPKNPYCKAASVPSPQPPGSGSTSVYCSARSKPK